MRRMKRIFISFFLLWTLVFGMQIPANADTVEYYTVNASEKTIEFDTSSGPLYKINYSTKKIIDCTSEGAKIVKCAVSGKKLTLVLYSDELPRKTTYTFDLSQNKEEAGGDTVDTKDEVEYYTVNKSKKTIEFDTSKGPYYKIKYSTKKIIDCTSEGAKIVKCTVSGKKLTLVLYSDELPRKTTYTFDLSQNKDSIDYYRVYPSRSVIEFDTAQGPYYKINYKKKKIVVCTSEGAMLSKCTTSGNQLTLVVYSDEHPAKATYSFDLSENHVKATATPLQIPARSFVGTDQLSFGLVNGEAIVTGADDSTAKTLKIPNIIKFGSRKIPVTGIAPGAFRGMKQLTRVTLGKNIVYIGKRAFLNCKKLDTITIKSPKMTIKTVGANAFKGIAAKANVKCPSGMKSSYKKILLKKGMKKTATFTD